jgi:hypothetical protein
LGRVLVAIDIMVPFRRLSQRSRRSTEENTGQNPLERKGERDQYIMTFPIHPLPSMQAPFEESMLDATGETGFVPFPIPNKTIDTRQQLLCRDFEADELTWNFTYNCHWRNNPKGKFHPLAKTITQIVFGVHLLHQHLEKSVADVADILLKHVNELDSFLQRANEDIEGSLNDMLFRRKCLKVPMEHVNEFDRLLDDRSYRAQLLDGNITIERTINRMSAMLNDYLIDMSTFRDANMDLEMYLHNIGDAWADANDDVGRIYSAMCGNTGGWTQFLQSLVAKAERLGVVLVQVSSYCNEIEKRCGAASRRSLVKNPLLLWICSKLLRYGSLLTWFSRLRADPHHVILPYHAKPRALFRTLMQGNLSLKFQAKGHPSCRPLPQAMTQDQLLVHHKDGRRLDQLPPLTYGGLLTLSLTNH